MPRSTVPGASTLGVTPQDVDAARRERDRLIAAHNAAKASAHERLKEMRDADGALPQTAEVREEVEQLFGEADTLGLEVDQAREHLARLQGEAYGADPGDQMPAEVRARRGGQPISIASRLFASEEFQRVRELAAANPQQAADIFRRELHDIPLADSSETAVLLSAMAATRGGVELAAQFDGDPIVPDDSGRIPTPIEIPTRHPVLLDLITVSTTGLDVVEYTVQLDETGNVTGRLPGSDFLEADITVERRSVPVVDRGTTLPVPERNLEDEGRIRAFLNGRLTGFLRRDAEANVLDGDGLDESFTGIQNWAGVGTYTRVAGENRADAIHKGITQVRMSLFDEPTAVALRADDWEGIVLEKDAEGRYVHSAGALANVPTSLWGFPGVRAHVLGENTSVVGRWEEAELIVRLGLQLREFEQHADFAKKRLVLIRALYRAAFVVNQPVAFSVVDTSDPA